MQRGYIKIWRKLEDSGLLQMPETLATMLFLILHATHKDVTRGTKYGPVKLDRGQGILAIRTLAKDMKLSVQAIRTILVRLERMQILTLQSTHAFSVYTIVNYNKYNDVPEQSTHESTNHQHTINTPPTQEQELKHLSIKEETTYTSLPATPKADNVPYQKIVDLYHENMPGNPRIAELTTKRKGQIAARWKSGALPDIETWEQFFKFCSKSKFLTGQIDPSPGRKHFLPNLEWLTTESNYTKILERKYHG